MIVYEITAEVESAPLEDFEDFMRRVHIPDLLATGYFSGAEIAGDSGGTYRIRYLAENRDSLDRYLETEAKRLRQDFELRFPAGIKVERKILEVLQTW